MLLVTGELTNKEDMEKVVASTLKKFGTVHILVGATNMIHEVSLLLNTIEMHCFIDVDLISLAKKLSAIYPMTLN